MGSLLVGVSFAKGFARSLGIPMIDVNHLQGHVLAHFIRESEDDNDQPTFPYLCLLVSGGNSQIGKVNSYKDMEILGQTIDDAAGGGGKSAEVGGEGARSWRVVDDEGGRGLRASFRVLGRDGPEAVRTLAALDFAFHGAAEAVEGVEVFERVVCFARLSGDGVEERRVVAHGVARRVVDVGAFEVLRELACGDEGRDDARKRRSLPEIPAAVATEPFV